MGSIQKQLSLFSFKIGEEWFAIPLNMVEGVADMPHEVTAIPGNKSRVFIGLAYILGQIMSVVDIGPLVNLSNARSVKQVVIVQLHGEYYALKVSAVGEIISKPVLKRVSNTRKGVLVSQLHKGKEKVVVVGMRTVINEHVCS